MIINNNSFYYSTQLLRCQCFAKNKAMYCKKTLFCSQNEFFIKKTLLSDRQKRLFIKNQISVLTNRVILCITV